MTPRRGELPPLPEPLPVAAVDAHTHLNACGCKDSADVVAMVDRAEAAGIGRVVTVADDLASARWVVEASTWDERVFAAVALHPTRTKEFSESDRGEFTKLATHPRVVAIGETGLDYYWDYSPLEAQQKAFRWHIELSKQTGKALMIHDRDAHDDVLRILDEEGAPSTVIFHSFSGDVEFAERCIAAGYVLSFSGVVTFRNAQTLRQVAKIVPVEQILVETDAPFLTPHPYRGQPNEPYCAAYTLREISRLRDADIAELSTIIRQNTERVFGLS